MAPFTVKLDPDGYIAMRLEGDLSAENFNALKDTVEEAKVVVKKYSEEKKGMVPVLFDLSGFTGVYNVGAMMAMKDLSDHNRPFVKKTAVFGGSPLARVAAELTIEFINDPTIRMFQDRESALEWLLKP
jgi:acetylornithine/succinyldiaminopimelate/putrescine aminotransferase